MHYTNRYWICPFFHWDEKGAIHCEGGSVVRLPQIHLYGFAEDYCASFGYRECSIYQAIEKTYEEEKDGTEHRPAAEAGEGAQKAPG